ncbi:hypothetical protein MKZ38_009730 [Zalerion maritima]|uniref:Uncharacterized protein n=1 Tax=Zalerion maritima TaxID=339359 RepID=A0AAD5WVI8_9PEZI|nr:hypothetical protein MKZ38_009730 [Zalerion maritima]
MSPSDFTYGSFSCASLAQSLSEIPRSIPLCLTSFRWCQPSVGDEEGKCDVGEINNIYPVYADNPNAEPDEHIPYVILDPSADYKITWTDADPDFSLELAWWADEEIVWEGVVEDPTTNGTFTFNPMSLIPTSSPSFPSLTASLSHLSLLQYNHSTETSQSSSPFLLASPLQTPYLRTSSQNLSKLTKSKRTHKILVWSVIGAAVAVLFVLFCWTCKKCGCLQTRKARDRAMMSELEIIRKRKGIIGGDSNDSFYDPEDGDESSEDSESSETEEERRRRRRMRGRCVRCHSYIEDMKIRQQEQRKEEEAWELRAQELRREEEELRRQEGERGDH